MVLPTVAWESSFELGIPYIDSQHRMLVDLIDKVSVTIAGDDASRDHLIRVLHEVKKYAEFHFASEENYMYEIRYPGLVAHQRIHSEMLSELSLRIARVRANWRSAIEVIAFLTEWLRGHVTFEDSKFQEHAESFAPAE